MSAHLYTVCQVGAEKALKAEVARLHPGLRFAYSRPGFVTFKSEAELSPDFALGSVFARAYGISKGKLTRGIAEFAELARGKCVHVIERDQHVPGEEPLGYEHGAIAD